MKTTYLIENSLNEVVGYERNLSDAKYHLSSLVNKGYPSNEIRIVCLKGQYFGEGYHFYKMYFINNSFKKVKQNQEDGFGIK